MHKPVNFTVFNLINVFTSIFTYASGSQTINQLVEKMKQGEHVFDMNAEPEPEPQDDDCPDFDADYEERLGDCEEGHKERKESCEASGSGKGR